MPHGPNGEELAIFATFAHHPRLLKRWSAFGGLLLAGGTLPGRDRELLILRTASNTGADYEWAQHVRIGREAGLSDAEIEAVADPGIAAEWPPWEATVLAAADQLHDDNRIDDPTWAGLAERFDEAQLIELCMVVGQYHLVAFTLNSLGVELES